MARAGPPAPFSSLPSSPHHNHFLLLLQESAETVLSAGQSCEREAFCFFICAIIPTARMRPSSKFKNKKCLCTRDRKKHTHLLAPPLRDTPQSLRRLQAKSSSLAPRAPKEAGLPIYRQSGECSARSTPMRPPPSLGAYPENRARKNIYQRSCAAGDIRQRQNSKSPVPAFSSVKGGEGRSIYF